MLLHRCTLLLVLLLSSAALNCFAEDDVTVDCPGKDEPFVTSCSGDGGVSESDSKQRDHRFDESDLANEVIEDSIKNEADQKIRESKPKTPSRSQSRAQRTKEEPGIYDDANTMHKLKITTSNLIQKYYEPVPRGGKCAIGTVCGFTTSRIALGAANRFFRLVGATWVLSEVLHASGYCDEALCVPEEARPWIGILQKKLIAQCIKVRANARKLWDQERIRELAEKDIMVSFSLFLGAFIGFVL